MFGVRDYIANRTTKPRRTRGPADGLLEEIQHEVLEQHPDWLKRLRELEDAPFPRPGLTLARYGRSNAQAKGRG